MIAVLISALADRKWFKLHGGKCKQEYLGAYQFLTPNIEDMACKYTASMHADLRMQYSYIIEVYRRVSPTCTCTVF